LNRPTPERREIYVPFTDLNVLLEGQPQRVLLTRQEYQNLLAAARKSPRADLPASILLTAGDYAVTVDDGRARIKGELSVELLDDGLQAIELPLGQVGLTSALLDGEPAAIGGEGPWVLFAEGKGRHVLVLEMTAPLSVSAAQQTLNFEVPMPPGTRIRMTVPGDVDVKGGADVASREVDDGNRVTRLEILPRVGPNSIVMSLNNRTRRTDRVVVAKSVLVNETTRAYEKLHTTISLAVLHQAIDRARFLVPSGFELSEVHSPWLARWAVADEGGQRVLEVQFREPTTETVVLGISAVRTPPQLDSWALPRIEPLDVVGQVAVVGLLVEDQVEYQPVSQAGLLPINVETLRAAIPASVFQRDPGSPPLRFVAAWYAPEAAFEHRASFAKPAPRVQAVTNLLLTVGDSSHHLAGNATLKPASDPLFEADLTVPAGWHLTAVTAPDGSALAYEKFPSEEGAARARIKLPRGVRPGEEFSFAFRATAAPAGWLGDWKEFAGQFPAFAVKGAARDEGALAIATAGDFTLRPEGIEGLTPLDDAERRSFHLADDASILAWRYDAQPYRASFTVGRTEPRLTARSYSFLKLEPAALHGHYELVYDVQEARARRLEFSLPENTPQGLSIYGLDGAPIKEFFSRVENGRRIWTVLLAEDRRGIIRLGVDFQDPLPAADAADLELPLAQAEGVVYQSGLVAVEGHADLEVAVTAAPRKLDVGELVDAQYQPGRRLLGVFGFVGSLPPVTVHVERPAELGLEPVLVERSELVTLVAAEGTSQSAGRFLLRTKAAFLEVQLPADSTLWSAALDGESIRPQRQGETLLVGLPPRGEGTVRDLSIVYETATTLTGEAGSLSLAAPVLSVRSAEEGRSHLVPVADLVWYLHLPSGYRVVTSSGTVVPDQPRMIDLAAIRVARTLLAWCGGINPFYRGGLFSAVDSELGSPSRSVENVLSPTFYTTRDSNAPDGSWMYRDPSVGMMPGAQREPIDEAELAVPTLTAPAGPGGSGLGGQTGGMGGGMPGGGMGGGGGMPGMGFSQGPGADPGMPSGAAGMPAQPQTPPPPPVAQPEPRRPGGGRWALTGLRSLKIDLDRLGPDESFRSLGADAILDVNIARHRRGQIGFAAALLVGIVGLALLNRPVRTKFLYVVGVMLVATVGAIVANSKETADACNPAFYAAAWLVPFYLAVGMLRWFGRKLHITPGAPVAAALLAATLLIAATNQAAAQPMPNQPAGSAPIEGFDSITYEDLLKMIRPGQPLAVPPDALLIPYDPDQPKPRSPEDVLLVPYEEYQALWRVAHPEPGTEERPLPAAFALAGADYSATLADADALEVRGKLNIEVFTDRPVTVPFHLHNGVLVETALDGNPARVRVVQAQSGLQGASPAGGVLFALELSGKGRHVLSLSARLPLVRQGGWRVAAGQLPTAPASALKLTIPQAETEVRLGVVADRQSYETTSADQSIETALGSRGGVAVQWRPKVAQGQVDLSLQARSESVFDVQEDGTRLRWRVDLSFARGQHDAFRLTIPADVIVEKVEGNNVRGFEVEPAEAGQRLEVTLLKPARDRELLTVDLARHGGVGHGLMAAFDVPVVSVEGAVLQTGRIHIRRSPMIDVRTADSTGLSRADTDVSLAEGLAAASESPLGIRPFQAWQFTSIPYRLRLSAEPVAARTTAQLQSVLRVAERERLLETRVRLSIQGRPLYLIRLAVPAELDLDAVRADVPFEWTRTIVDGRSLVTVFTPGGVQGDVDFVLGGRLGSPGVVAEVPLPGLEVLGAAEQQGDLVIQADPAFDLAPAGLENCQSVLLSTVFGWLRPDQQGLARAVIHHDVSGYAGVVRLTPRTPVVQNTSITNVRVTDRAVEETILIDFKIREAGIRTVSFLLPASLADARIRVPLLRQKVVEPSAPEPGSPVRVRLELQDEVLGQLRVLITNDRVLSAETIVAPIPVVETGHTDRQYVALESSGVDEVLVDAAGGVEALGRQQSQWQEVAAILGAGLTQVYVVKTGTAAPRLAFKTKDRQAVETASARIGLAETLLVLDSHGAYRASQTYHMDNTTEQYLEVELPPEATLWTARVAGEPVKPVRSTSNLAGHLRIPLVKTEAGDLDYEVTLKYGGKIEPLLQSTDVEFPLVRSVNINVELSQVRLFVPDTHRWFNFDGTMSQVRDEAELEAGILAYKNKLIERLSEIASTADDYKRTRAMNNLKHLTLFDMKSKQSSDGQGYYANENFKKEAVANAALLDQVRRQIEAGPEQSDALGDGTDNRFRLNDLFLEQKVDRSKNVANKAGSNFDTLSATPAENPLPTKPEDSEQLQTEWLEKNQLRNDEADAEKSAESLYTIQKPGYDVNRLLGGEQGQGPMGRGGDVRFDDLVTRELRDGVSQSEELPAADAPLATELDDRQDRLRRYQQRLEEQTRGQASAGGRSATAQTQAPPSGPFQVFGAAPPQLDPAADGFSPDGRTLSLGGIAQPGNIAGQVPTSGYAPSTGTTAADAAGLSSLDVAIPERGRLYRFSTPRGQIEITARAVESTLVDRAANLIGVVFAMAFLAMAYNLFKRGISRWGGLALALLGLVGLMTGILPLAAIVALLVGFVAVVYPRKKPMPAAV
jgi:hypothetical protein